MKFAETRIYADPERAARKLVEIASTIEPVQEGRIHIEKNQRAVSLPGTRHTGRIQRRLAAGNRARLACDA
jgi:hypothetical protein